jgi:hypothetical protein
MATVAMETSLSVNCISFLHNYPQFYSCILYIFFAPSFSVHLQKRIQRPQEQPLHSVLEFGLDLFKGKVCHRVL